MRPIALKVLILTTLMTGAGLAQSEDEAGRGVARVSLMNGDVSVRRGDSGDWVAAAVNAPLVVQDSVLAGAGSRAEVQFDWANMIRLASNTEIRLAQLDNQRYIIQIARGTTTFRVQRDSEADVELSTPSVSVRPLEKGSYRITVNEAGESEITVRSGEAEVFTPRGVERLRSGRTMLARGSAADPEFQIVSAIARDDWDRWNDERDRFLSRSKGYRYAHRSVYGVEDLDGYGHWVHVAPYGWCWYPRVAVGWAPYYYGRWAWVDWYGWTWVSYDPWGWAPYHYGRWFYQRPYGWCWWPGGVHIRHHWRPALVAFFGWGRHSGFHVGVGIGFGHVGWVPLAPYERYHPWYGRRHYHGYRNTTYIDNSVNIVNNTNIYNVYRNARITNAVTGVDASQFGRGNGNLVRVSRNELGRVDLVKGPLPVAPGRESLRLANREVRMANLPRNSEEGRFFSRRQPAAVDRVPFEEQRRGMERVSRRVFGEPGAATAGGVRSPRATTPGGAPGSEPRRAGDGNLARTAEQNRASEGGWRRVGETPRNQTQERSWRRFGEPVVRQTAPAQSAPRVMERTRSQEENRQSIRTQSQEQRQDSSSWRRFGEPSRGMESPGGLVRREQTSREVQRRQVEAQPDAGVSRRESSGAWRRFEDRGDSGRGNRMPDSSERSGRDFGSIPRRERSEPAGRFEAPERNMPRYEPRGRSESIRISPPIIRERSTSRSGGSSRIERAPQPRSSGGGAVRSAPSGGGSVRGGSMPRGNSGGRTSGGESRSGGGRRR